jgi:prophage regulatory protein
MQRRRLNQSQQVHTRTTTMDDLFDSPARLTTPTSTPAPQPIDDELWSVRTITAKTGLARSTIYAYVKRGLLPRQRRLGPGRVGWRASEVRRWMAALQPASEPIGPTHADALHLSVRGKRL